MSKKNLLAKDQLNPRIKNSQYDIEKQIINRNLKLKLLLDI
ncbi:MAG: hypothetical protein PHV30_02135 [Candidatus Margulisbacteria bacterium]|nr:hypothetical protein [Candidatus Margulisiibacteriota bacterium]